MKTRLPLILLVVSLLLTARGQGTSFTYQGRLNDGTNPANGIYDLQFGLYDAATAGTLKGGLLTNSATGVTNGLFTVTLDFGNQFPGTDRFLEISVRTNGAAGFSTLNPRQALRPAPYSITAGNVVSGGLTAGTYGSAVTFSNSANQFSGVFTGNGANITNVNATTLGGLSSSGFWTTAGNTNANPTNGNFIGTIDNLPLDIRVNNQRVMRFAYASNAFASDNPNVIGGSPVNFVKPGVAGATIAGGGRSFYTNSVQGDFGSIGGGLGNSAFGFYDTIGGGLQNSSGSFVSDYSTVGGGTGNIANGDSATVSGGNGNFASGGQATVGGGAGNGVQQQFGTVGGGTDNSVIDAGPLPNPTSGTVAGGFSNVVHGAYASIPGGEMNTADGDFSLAAGRHAKANHDGAFVWADSIDADFASTRSNQFIIRAGGGVGIGTAAPATVLHVRDTGDTEISVESIQSGERWTIQSSGTNTPGKFGTFQIIDRTAGASRLLIDTNGNVGIGAVPTNKLHVAGGITCTAVTTTSDRNAKENFEPVSPREVLNKVAALPIMTWNFKDLRDGRHMGPMAQDFYSAFQLGGSDKTITSVDPDGVALAAIQGLNQKLEDKSQKSDGRIQKLEAENAELKQRLAALERLVLPQNETEMSAR
jgi:hypothetical protein